MSGPSHSAPKSAFGKWIYERLPVTDLTGHMLDFPTPKNLNYWWTFGGILSIMLVAQI
ncbi:MAG: cytochrome b, partial [Alphaproteobacteria bacterium]|nr:cytochrome b [Alphaproteobacteria bacterium]